MQYKQPPPPSMAGRMTGSMQNRKEKLPVPPQISYNKTIQVILLAGKYTDLFPL